MLSYKASYQTCSQPVQLALNHINQIWNSGFKLDWKLERSWVGQQRSILKFGSATHIIKLPLNDVLKCFLDCKCAYESSDYLVKLYNMFKYMGRVE